MAALVKREPLLRELYLAFRCGNVSKYSSLPPKKKPPKPKPGPMIYHNKQKLETKGYLRPLKGYTPPENVEEKLNTILATHANNLSLNSQIKEPLIQFKILEACSESFQHSVPNSQLHKMNSVGDILEFYQTPVDTLTPLEHLKASDLPPNLAIQLEAKKFDPEEKDAFHGGISAFPQSPTFVTSVYSKKKYKPVEAQNWVKDWREKALGYIRW